MKRRIQTTRKNPQRRRGVNSVQLALFLPLLIIFTIAVVQFGLCLVAKQTVANSAAEGVQTAARGGDLDDITRTVARGLGTDGIPIRKDGDVAILVERHGKQPEIAGNAAVSCCPFGPDLQPGEVRVTVCVRRGGSTNNSIPSWLGDNFSPRRLQFSSLAAIE